MVPMIGASAAISGCMAAAMRFAFQQGGPLGFGGRPTATPTGCRSLRSRDPAQPALILRFGAWFGLNALFGIGTVPIAGEGQDIAWQAHIGGFVAGLILFAVRSRVSRRAENDHRPQQPAIKRDRGSATAGRGGRIRGR